MRPFLLFFLVLSLLTSRAQVKSVHGPDSSKPFILGQTIEIQSAILSEKRTLNIYLPEGYNKNDTAKYPVVYLLDGGADEDFIHVVGLFQFNSFSWINRVPKSIIVGIANTNRIRDFTYESTIADETKRFPQAGKSASFINFIEKELQPFIRSNYNTRDETTIIGESLGGLLATEILLKKPALFDKYIIISPSLWWDNGSLLNLKPVISDKSSAEKRAIYIGTGKEGLGPGKFPHVMEVDANLMAEKLMNLPGKNYSVYLDYLPEENHATVSHQAIFNALRILYPKKGGQ